MGCVGEVTAVVKDGYDRGFAGWLNEWLCGARRGT